MLAPLGPAGHLLRKVTLPTPGDIADHKCRESAKVRGKRNVSKMKEQDKIPEKEINETEPSSLPNTEFKTLLIRVFGEFMGRTGKLSENLHEEAETIKKNQSEVRNTVPDIKNT